MENLTVRSGITGLYTHRSLLRSLVVRDLQTKYRGTVLGFLWAIIYPLTMLAVYAFVFGVIFKARWGAGQGQMSDFVLMMYCGLIVFGIFSETVSRAPSTVVSKPSYVKKVVFPLELLPTVDLVSAAFNALIGLGLLGLFLLAKQQYIPWTTILLPVVLAPLLLVTVGLAWLLAAIGVFFRDIGQIIGVAMSVMMFMSPVFYPVSSVPAFAQKLLYLNPLTYPIEAVRQVLILGAIPDWQHWLAYSGAATLMAVVGLWVFQRARPAFADVV